MKKTLMIAAATVALIPAAHAQDKYGSTYSHQSATTTSQPQATNDTNFYHNNSSSSSSSADTGSYNSPLTGLYAGVEGGYDWSDLDTAAGNANVNGWDYGLFLGYKLDHLIQNNMGINAAIEAHYDWSNADDDFAGATVEKDHEWGIDFRPGISVSDMFNPYGIIGYERAEFKGSAGGFTGSDDYNGFVLGAGTELVSWNNVGARIDYTHTWYDDKGGIDPDEDEVKLGLAYHFQ